MADTLAEEPTLEAVTIDTARRKISVATLGRADVDKLTRAAHRQNPVCAKRRPPAVPVRCWPAKAIALACDTPLSEAEQKRITIQRDGDVTTIARVTCPTAPKFWRWRDLPFPRIEPRDA